MKIIRFIAFLIPCLAVADTFLIFGGKTGWIGQKIVKSLEEQNHQVFCATSRLENREELINELELIKPDYIIDAAGVTGRPNVDWCESNQQTTIRTNILGTLNLIDVAYLKGIHVTLFGTGCIYKYDETHPMYSGMGFKETDKPNFEGSFYSLTKSMLDKLLESYPNVLNLRLRMPITSDFHPRNFITKITNYPKLINIPNSMTILDDLIPIAIDLTIKRKSGKMNFTNPGTISHNELLTLYQEYIDPNFTWENFSIEEQNKILKAERSNNELDVTKLLNNYPNIPHIKDSIHEVFKRMRDSIVLSTP